MSNTQQAVGVQPASKIKADNTASDQKAAADISFLKLFSFADGLDALLIALGSIGAIVSGLAMPAVLRVLLKFIDAFEKGQQASATTAAQYASYFLYIGVIVCIGSFTEVLCWTYAGERQTFKMRSMYLEAILFQDVQEFDLAFQTGELIESISSDILLAQEAIGEKMGSVIHFLSTFVGCIIMALLTVWQMALVTVAIIPLLTAAAALQAFIITNVSSKSQDAYAQAGGVAEQAIAQVRAIYSFVSEAKAIQAYCRALEHAQQFGYKVGFSKGLGVGAMFLAAYGSFSLLVWAGSVLIFQGSAKGASVLITMFNIISGAIALGQASLSFATFGKAKGAAMKIFKVIGKSTLVEQHSENKNEITSLHGEVEFKGVNFSYPSRPHIMILQNFSLTISRGKSVAIVGSSGSGKSTIVALLERFYEPSAGCIYLDGHDIRTLQLKWLRMQLGLVSQEPSLFATSIKENILVGKENATMEEIENAAKFSHAHAFIQKLPSGYDTQVGERGVQLSGGQKQRIAIARAVIKNPSILLLDEATSALDSSSEKLVQDTLDQFMTARTSIVIAHRLSTIEHVDMIAVVEKGKLVEIGSHDELMQKAEAGAYCKLVKLQQTSSSLTEGENYAQISSSNSTPHCMPRSTSRRKDSPSYIASPFGLHSYVDQSENSFSISVDVRKTDETDALDVDAGAGHSGYFWRLVKLNIPEWRQALLGSFGCVLTGVVNPFAALLLASVATVYYYPDHNYVRNRIRLYATCFVILAVVGLIGYIIQEYFWGYVCENLATRVRQRMFSAILRNEVSWFDRDENSSSQLSARLSLDAAAIRTVVGGKISLLLQNFTQFGVTVIISLIFSWKMALVTLSVFPFVVIGAVAERFFLKGYAGDMEQAHRKANTIAGEAVANIRTVVAFNAQAKILSLFTQELSGTLQNSLRQGEIAGLALGFANFFRYSADALALWYGLSLVRHGEDPGAIIKVFFVQLVGAVVIGGAIGTVPDLVRGGEALKSVFGIIDRVTDIDPDEDLPRLNEVKGKVELKHVEFSYPARPDVLIFKNLNLRVPAGTSMALVGRSGCGKSTVVALIERFYDPVRGKVMIDGVDIRCYNLKSLRHHIGLVQQEPSLFANTIYENILYGNSQASAMDVEAAARAANAHEFISALPDGYHTFVGERGVQLSGGQKQRVAIARAVLKNPTILLLDEATSALDAESEKVVQEALEKLMQGRTVVVIAHRLSTVCNLDRIAVIQDGAVVEQGTHSSLLSNKLGAYSQLVALQKTLQTSST